MAEATSKTLDLSTLTDVEREILKTAILLSRDATAALVKPAVRQRIMVKDIPQALNGLAEKGLAQEGGRPAAVGRQDSLRIRGSGLDSDGRAS